MNKSAIVTIEQVYKKLKESDKDVVTRDIFPCVLHSKVNANCAFCPLLNIYDSPCKYYIESKNSREFLRNLVKHFPLLILEEN